MHMEPLYEIPFMPAYDPILPINDVEKRGVLCIQYRPGAGICTVRVQRDMIDIMSKLNCVFNNTSRVFFYKLGKKLVITQDESPGIYTDVITYNGKTYDAESNVLICNQDFMSLTESEALSILESARLYRGKNNSCVIKINLGDE